MKQIRQFTIKTSGKEMHCDRCSDLFMANDKVLLSIREYFSTLSVAYWCENCYTSFTNGTAVAENIALPTPTINEEEEEYEDDDDDNDNDNDEEEEEEDEDEDEDYDDDNDGDDEGEISVI